MRRSIKIGRLTFICFLLSIIFFCNNDNQSQSKKVNPAIVMSEGNIKYKIPIEELSLFVTELESLRVKLIDIVLHSGFPKKDNWETNEEYDIRKRDSLLTLNKRAEDLALSTFGDVLIKCEHKISVDQSKASYRIYMPNAISFYKENFDYIYKLHCLTEIYIDTLIYDADGKFADLLAIEKHNDLLKDISFRPPNDKYFIHPGNMREIIFQPAMVRSTRDGRIRFTLYPLQMNEAKALFNLIKNKKVYLQYHYYYDFGYLLKLSRFDYFFYDNIFEISGPHENFFNVMTDDIKLFHVEQIPVDRIDSWGSLVRYWSGRTTSFNHEKLK